MILLRFRVFADEEDNVLMKSPHKSMMLGALDQWSKFQHPHANFKHFKITQHFLRACSCISSDMYEARRAVPNAGTSTFAM